MTELDDFIRYVYFVYGNNELIYIGITKHPLRRSMVHANSFRTDYNTIMVEFYGPYDKSIALQIEANEIFKNRYYDIKSTSSRRPKDLKKICVKNNEREFIYRFTVIGGKKKMVREYIDKQRFRELCEKN